MFVDFYAVIVILLHNDEFFFPEQSTYYLQKYILYNVGTLGGEKIDFWAVSAVIFYFS